MVKFKRDVVSRPLVWLLSGVLCVLGASFRLPANPLDVVLLWVGLESQSPILDRHLEAWHRDCDAPMGEPVEHQRPAIAPAHYTN